MDLETRNFKDFSEDEYRDNLLRLGIGSHSSLVGKEVFYVKPEYGKHTVIMWDSKRAEYLLDLDGQRFYSNPFRIVYFP